MAEHPLDDFIRKKLEDYSSPVPGDMWNRIQQKREKERRFLFFWRTLVAALLLGGMATGYYLLQAGDETIQNQQSLAINVKPQDGPASQTEIPSRQPATADDSAAAQLEGDLAYRVHKDPVVPGVGFTPSVDAGKEQKFSGQIGRDTGAYAEYQPGITPMPVIVPGSAAAVVAAPPAAVIVAEPVQQASGTAEAKVEKQQVATVPRTYKQQKDTTGAADIAADDEPVIKGLALEVYASPDFPINMLKSDNTELETQKKAAEQMQLSYSVGLRLNMKLDDRFSAMIGINYAQINQRFEYSKYEVRNVPVIINRSFTDEFGIQSVYTDTAMYLQAGTRTITSGNTYRSIDMPVLMGYRIGKGKMQTTITGGVVFNLTSKYNGVVLDGSLNPVSLDNNTVYNNNLGMSVYAGMNMSWTLKPRVQLFSEPYLRYRLGNMAKPSQGFTQKFHAGGLSVGLRYQF